MRISDWSSDVCSSDLERNRRAHVGVQVETLAQLDVDRRKAAANRRGQRALERDLVLADRIHRRLRQQFAVLVERSEEHTSELQSLMRISYAVFCLKKKKAIQNQIF